MYRSLWACIRISGLRHLLFVEAEEEEEEYAENSDHIRIRFLINMRPLSNKNALNPLTLTIELHCTNLNKDKINNEIKI